MFDKIKKNLLRENTMKQNFWDVIAFSYTPILMLVVYFGLPEYRDILKNAMVYELTYILLAIMLLSYAISPLLKGIQQYRNRNKLVR